MYIIQFQFKGLSYLAFYLIFFLSFDRFNLPTDIFAGGSVGRQLLDNLVDLFQRCCDGPETHTMKNTEEYLSALLRFAVIFKSKRHM